MTLIRKYGTLRDLVKRLTNKALRHEGIPIGTSFFVLSPQNPYSEPLNRAMALYLPVKQQLQNAINEYSRQNPIGR